MNEEQINNDKAGQTSNAWSRRNLRQNASSKKLKLEALEPRLMPVVNPILTGLDVNNGTADSFGANFSSALATVGPGQKVSGFPTGPDNDFYIMSTGNAAEVFGENTSGNQGTDLGNPGAQDDFVVMSMTIPVPASDKVQKLKFDLMYLTEDFPERSNGTDADVFTIRYNGVLVPPSGSPFDPWSIATMNFEGLSADGTIFDARSSIRTIEIDVDPGLTNINLSVAIQEAAGTETTDSALFLDNLRFEARQIVYLDFDGETFNDFFRPGTSTTMNPFQSSDVGSTDAPAIVGLDIALRVALHFNAFDVGFTTIKPLSGDYMHVAIGGNNLNTTLAFSDPLLLSKYGPSVSIHDVVVSAAGGDPTAVLYGKAAKVDLENLDHRDRVIIFSGEIANEFGAETSDEQKDRLAAVLSHEIAHALGARHLLNSEADQIMKQQAPLSGTSQFQDRVSLLAENNWVDGATTQNSYGYLNRVLGPGSNAVAESIVANYLVKSIFGFEIPALGAAVTRLIVGFKTTGLFSASAGVVDSDAVFYEVPIGAGPINFTLPNVYDKPQFAVMGSTRQDGVINFYSGQQVGGVLNPNDIFVPMYDVNGNLNTNIPISSGAPGSFTSSGFAALTAAAAPVNGKIIVKPDLQTTPSNRSVIFSAGNSNLVQIGAQYGQSLPIELTLTASDGKLSLGSIANLTFLSGDGTADQTMSFRGTLASINAALAGMRFTPNSGFQGTGYVTIQTFDLGTTATAGALSDTDIVEINVTAPVAPENVPPTSSVNALPATAASANFQVSWTGTDNAGGSGLATFDIFVSDNNGQFTVWQDNTTATTATFNGQAGHTYRFYSIATDIDGNVESAPGTPDATTTVPAPDTTAPSSAVNALPATTASLTFQVSWTGADNNGGSGIASFDIFVSDDNGPYTLWQDNSAATSAQYAGQVGHTYRFYSVATDNSGNVEVAPANADATILVVGPDVTAPSSSVNALPATTSNATFQVSWTGTDNVGGTGIATYDILVSDDNGPFTVWQAQTAATSANYPGVVGHTYRFFSIATDNSGNVEPNTGIADATTTVTSGPIVGPLVITGTSQDDFYEIFRVPNSPTDVEVFLNGASTGTFTPTGAITINSGAGNDTIVGAGDLTMGLNIDAGDGDDSIIGGGSNDTFSGGLGNDKLFGGLGNDLLFGGDGADSIDGQTGNDSMDGGNDADTLDGGDGDDLIFGSAGNDLLRGGNGNDNFNAGDDNDTVLGQAGIDYIEGGNGADSLLGGDDPDGFDAGAGDDFVDGGLGNDFMYGFAGNDTLLGQDGSDGIDAGAGNDSVDAGPGNDFMYGLAGNDTLIGGDGNDGMDGGADNDSMLGGNGDDLLFGNFGNDIELGQAGNDSIDGNAGNDTLDGAADNDLIFASGGGADLILGGAGNDTLQNIDASATIFGGAGNDLLYGANFTNDSLLGEDGNDTITGLSGNDTITTGAGADVVDGGAGTDLVTDAQAGDVLFNVP